MEPKDDSETEWRYLEPGFVMKQIATSIDLLVGLSCGCAFSFAQMCRSGFGWNKTSAWHWNSDYRLTNLAVFLHIDHER